MKKAHDILINGRPEMILWAESPEAAIVEAKEILFWDHPRNKERNKDRVVTAAPRIY